MSLEDLIRYIEISNLEEPEKRWLIANIKNLQSKFMERFGHAIEEGL